jgi:DNA gyrase subunit A
MLDTLITKENIIDTDISYAVQRSYLDYAMSVIISRALPDVRDGLKPVHRRILYSMYVAGFLSNKPHRKSARIVGDVMGKFHPHGNDPIYDAMVRMQQDFSLRAPLIDGQGNFGSLDGDNAAAMRYTEARLSKIANTLLEDIHYETVDFRPNYDGSEKEPVILPSRLPNLLINGSSGIAVGMATNIPPHNLGQVIDACYAYVDNEDIDIEELINLVEGPDFPTRGYVNALDLGHAYRTGKGIVAVKGKSSIEAMEGKREAIIISEIPYGVNKAKLVEKISELVKEGKIEGISDLRDESSNAGIRVVVELKSGVMSAIVERQLYKLTPLQTSFGINMLALDQGIPKLMNLKEIIAAFINFRKEIIYKRTVFLLKEARMRQELLGGLFVAVSNVNDVVQSIKASNNFSDAQQKLTFMSWSLSDLNVKPEDLLLIKKDELFYLTERQAKSILEMRLQRLTGLEKKKIEEELSEVLNKIQDYQNILNSRKILLEILKSEISEIKNNFATPRLTQISNTGFEIIEQEELIPEEDMVATFTLSGYVKRVSLESYKVQKRGGRGKQGLSIVSDDVITNFIVGSTHANLLFFTNIGQVYKLKMYNLPLCSLSSRGKQINSLIPLKGVEFITSILILSNEEDKERQEIIFSTALGKIRRNSVLDFANIPSNGKIAMKLKEGDELVGVSICSKDDDIFLATNLGKCIRFSVNGLRIFKSRSSDGVGSIKLIKNDKVIAQVILGKADFSVEQRELYLAIKLATRKKFKLAQGSLELTNLLKKNEELSSNFSIEDLQSMSEKELFVLSITENGYAKCSSSYSYRVANRRGMGIANISASAKIGKVVAVVALTGDENEELMVVTNLGKTIRIKTADVRVTGRNTAGVLLVKMRPDETVVCVAYITDDVPCDQ